MTSRYFTFLTMANDASGIKNNTPTALAELIYADLDKGISFMDSMDEIDEDSWNNHCELLTFLLTNYSIYRNLSSGELLGLINGTVNLWAHFPNALKPLDAYLYNGITVQSAMDYFSNRAPTIYANYDGMTLVDFHLSAAEEILEEYVRFDGDGEPIINHITTAIDSISATQTVLSNNKESN